MKLHLPALLLLSLSACGPSTIVPAHELQVELDYDGVRSTALIAFPEHDAEMHQVPGDDSCELFSGNCGYATPSIGTVQGQSPITRAEMTTTVRHLSITYDFFVERSESDQEEYSSTNHAYNEPEVLCRIYDTQLGEPLSCAFSTRSTQVVARNYRQE